MGFRVPRASLKGGSVARLAAREQVKNMVLLPKLRRVFALLNELPYKAVATLSVVVGSGLLYRYFLLIEYTPTNLPSMLALAGLAAAWCFAAMVMMTLCLFGTVATIYAYEVKGLPTRVVFLGQVWPALVAAPLVLKGGTGWALGLTGLGLACVTTYLQYQWSRGHANRHLFLAFVAPVLGAALIYCAVEVGVSVVGGESYGRLSAPWQNVIRAALLLALFALSAVLTHQKLVPIFVVLTTLLITFFLTIALTPRGLVSATMAKQLGLRLPGLTELTVPVSTCRLLLNAVGQSEQSGKSSEPLQCLEGVNRVAARIDLRFGDRWLISVDSVNGRCVTTPMRRLTIPDAGTEVVLPELGASAMHVKCGDQP